MGQSGNEDIKRQLYCVEILCFWSLLVPGACIYSNPVILPAMGNCYQKRAGVDSSYWMKDWTWGVDVFRNKTSNMIDVPSLHPVPAVSTAVYQFGAMRNQWLGIIGDNWTCIWIRKTRKMGCKLAGRSHYLKPFGCNCPYQSILINYTERNKWSTTADCSNFGYKTNVYSLWRRSCHPAYRQNGWYSYCLRCRWWHEGLLTKTMII